MVSLLNYVIAILLGSFLLFSVQPMIAKIILPWFGGTAAVWTTCLLFFQVMLLLGYLYAFGLIRKLRPRQQGWVHLAMLGASLMAQHVMPDPAWRPQGDSAPEFRIIALLLASIGFPYLVLSTTSPLLQAWFARTHPAVAPYRLFALSNVGSLLALIGFPLLIEPGLATRWQTNAWLGLYGLFVVVCARVTVYACLRPGADEEENHGPEEKSSDDSVTPSRGIQVLWVASAALASTLLLAISNHLTQNVAPVPLLWILPLGLYLLSFILCFEGHSLYWRPVYVSALVVCVTGCAWALTSDNVNATLTVQVPLFATTLFVACMVCHGELARLRPHPRYLTGFYLAVSAGGALGGVCVALLAPRLFIDCYELHLALAGSMALVVAVLGREAALGAGRRRWALAACGFLMATACGLISWSLWSGTQADAKLVRAAVRSFYGALRVTERNTSAGTMWVLQHGSIKHGLQFLSPDKRRWPTTYYTMMSGAGVAIMSCGRPAPQKVGIVGLGTGTLAAYGRKGDTYRIYEINPDVVLLANSSFSYLQDCPAWHNIVLGDARLSLEREAPNGFDVLAVDAFSGDAIPVHLLTREAFVQYFRHLKPGGILAIHVSNRYLDLAPIVGQAANSLQKQAMVVDAPDDSTIGGSASSWVLVGGDPAFFKLPAVAHTAHPIEPAPGLLAWSDDDSNLYQILRLDPVRDAWTSFWQSFCGGRWILRPADGS